MPSTILHKRASAAGKVPMAADLASGELSINTRDAILFMKKTVGGVDSVVRVGAEMSPLVAGALAKTNWGDMFDALGVTNLLLREAPVIAAGQSAIDFSAGWASWRDRVNIHFSGFSTNGTSPVLIQVGDFGGFETTGYGATGLNISGTSLAHVSSSAGFLLTPVSAGEGLTGTVVLSRHGTASWVASGGVRRSATASALVFGDKTLTETLTQVRITTANGTDTFDAGSVSVSWE
jgi:hypothetical protein